MALDSLIPTEQDAQTPPAVAKPDVSKRTENFIWGIPQNGLEQKEREVLLDEPPVTELGRIESEFVGTRR